MAVCLTAGYLVAADAAAQPRLSGPRDSAIGKLAADGSQLVWGTLLGGSGEDDTIMEEDDTIVGENDTIMEEDDAIMREDNVIMQEDDAIIGANTGQPARVGNEAV